MVEKTADFGFCSCGEKKNGRFSMHRRRGLALIYIFLCRFFLFQIQFLLVSWEFGLVGVS
jgi:hypothetical protein